MRFTLVFLQPHPKGEMASVRLGMPGRGREELPAPHPCSISLHVGAGSQCRLFHRHLPAELCLMPGGRGGERCHGAAGMELCSWISPPCVFPLQPDRPGTGPGMGSLEGPCTPVPIPSSHPSPGSCSSPPSSWALPGAAPVCQGRTNCLFVPSSPSALLGAITLPGPGCTGRSGASAAGDG